MSRSGYTDDNEDPLALGRWRQAVKKATQGKRGQALLSELIEALDAMDVKRLQPGSFKTVDGEFCALGVLGAKRGLQMSDLGDEDDCDPAQVGLRFGIAPAMAAEIMYLNDDYFVDEWKCVNIEFCGPVRPHGPDYGSHVKNVRVPNADHPYERWKKMRQWATEQLVTRMKGCKFG
ncbi:hypothetical protein [Rhodoferax antarcticus]|uniref:Uncharacterized protein n=1 Tax=Rhodoferax antarcticus ANT.BR TaxID=1111071 RepID=A0A1Q8Y976_9BURK|nr:hypothetical protein [Rhodoferax antarcticus]OLP04534.1 hypothetical protein BLL52_4274 [Rhodoferax antarcticus ANT.BR]